MNFTTQSAKDLSKLDASTLLLFIAQDDKDSKQLRYDFSGQLASHLNAKFVNSLIKDANESEKFKGAPKETLFFRGALSSSGTAFKHLLIVGLGKGKSVDAQALRIAGCVTVKALSREKVAAGAIAVKSLAKFHSDLEEIGECFAEGAILGSYKYEEMKSAKKEKTSAKVELRNLIFVVDDKAGASKLERGLNRGQALGEATCLARDLGNKPGNVLTPTTFAEHAVEAAKGLPIKVAVWGEKEIEKAKMGCLLGVNRGSDEEPRFIIMEYHGGGKSEKPFVMVGKGLTFDSGGISLKPGAGMEEMKFDMCGGAAVVGAIIALAKIKAKVNAVAVVPSTDNMPGGAAVKPGDVLVASNSKTVEVNNTDAEGRLILSDALVYACSLKPKAIVDAATLTGACQVALGNVFTGFFCKDGKFTKQIVEASEESGERIWQLPLTDDYVEDMKGTYADLSNTGNAKGGGASQGAAFLSQFVDENIPWAHFDIAATAWNAGSRTPLNPDKGATGVAVRMFAKLAQILAGK